MSQAVLGYEESGSGDLLLLIHGFPLDSSMWSEQIDALSESRRVVAVDLRGRGRSHDIPLAGASISAYADDVAQTIDALGAGKVDLAALSMGGYVAFEVWRRYRDRVRSLILIDTKAEADSDEAKEGRTKTANLVREQGASALIEGLLPKLVTESASEDVKARLRKMFENTPGETASADALAMRDRNDSVADLAGIDVPVLVIHGEQDQIMPVDGARQMAEQIPNAKFVAIPDAGHMAPMENPEAVNQAIEEFLSSM